MQIYDKYILAFSGGKDCTACFLELLEQGVPTDKIELWHHLIDGAPDSKSLMDWTVTQDYCRKFAAHFGVAIYFSWKEGGFEREMLRDDQLTAPSYFETPTGVKKIGGIKGNKSTRLKFPQVSTDLNVRWCSAYLKIDICAASIRNQKRFRGKRVVVISGERGEESPARSKYETLEADRADLRNGKHYVRYVDRLRLVKDWDEQRVWDIIEKCGIIVHPCYYIGYSRCSCQFCIFGDEVQFATSALISPDRFDKLVWYERIFGVTLKRDKTLPDLVNKARMYKGLNEHLRKLVTSKEYTGLIVTDKWEQPLGAFGHSCGPT